MITTVSRDGRHAVRLRRFIGHAAANLLDVEEVTTAEGLAAIEPAWEGLLARSDVDHPFLTPAWIRTFWDAFGEAGSLMVLVVRRHGQVIGIAPLVRRERTMYGMHVRTVETLRNSHSPRSDFILSTHPTPACGAILQHLIEQQSTWDLLELAQFPETSVAYSELRRIARFSGLLSGAEDFGGSPYVERPTDWASYLRSLPAKHRSNLRNRRARLERIGPLALETVSGGPGLSQAIEDAFRLESSGWKRGTRSAISSEHATESFYTTFARRAAASGWLRLQFLTVGDRRIAAIYALRYLGRHHVLKLGYNPEFASYSPGQLLCLLAFEHAFAEGAVEVDLLGEPDPWKLSWTSSVRPHRWLFVFPDHFRARCLYLAKFGVVPRLRRSGLLRALKDTLTREEGPR